MFHAAGHSEIGLLNLQWSGCELLNLAFVTHHRWEQFSWPCFDISGLSSKHESSSDAAPSKLPRSFDVHLWIEPSCKFSLHDHLYLSCVSSSFLKGVRWWNRHVDLSGICKVLWRSTRAVNLLLVLNSLGLVRSKWLLRSKVLKLS